MLVCADDEHIDMLAVRTFATMLIHTQFDIFTAYGKEMCTLLVVGAEELHTETERSLDMEVWVVEWRALSFTVLSF